ncbi:hypothetical protein ACOZE3_33345 [Streptomyces cinereoruber]|uniref:hypothetical protein n=1 Tax=Streptomyces cinereoruber TaxID=67260 RepID=UPI003BF5CCA5
MTPVSTSPAARRSAFTQPERPRDLQIRYLTVGGSYVDVTPAANKRLGSRWHCHGCKAVSEFPDTDYLSRIREKANDHAGSCRAIPLT